jgi:hypothetical protein
MSPVVAGCRYACVASRLKIDAAHARSSVDEVGRHEKIRRRLGV